MLVAGGKEATAGGRVLMRNSWQCVAPRLACMVLSISSDLQRQSSSSHRANIQHWQEVCHASGVLLTGLLHLSREQERAVVAMITGGAGIREVTADSAGPWSEPLVIVQQHETVDCNKNQTIKSPKQAIP